MTKDLIPKEWNILLERTLADVTNAFVPIADYLQQKGNPLGERLVNLDIHSKLDELIKLSCGLTLDLLPADNGSKRTQDQWFNQYWNTVTAGTVMASMGDLYRNFKTLKRVSEQGTVEQKMLAQTLLASLRDDFDWPGKNLLISSTRINYAENKSLDGEIIHH
ncbi:MAG: hypothetical protein Q8R37_05650, partial [Nanoarchaeota archaeon]|nr:hypothetical protein [Nanoarchaeota archaeon]